MLLPRHAVAAAAAAAISMILCPFAQPRCRGHVPQCFAPVRQRSPASRAAMCRRLCQLAGCTLPAAARAEALAASLSSISFVVRAADAPCRVERRQSLQHQASAACRPRRLPQARGCGVHQHQRRRCMLVRRRPARIQPLHGCRRLARSFSLRCQHARGPVRRGFRPLAARRCLHCCC